jgi:hypothetical protein
MFAVSTQGEQSVEAATVAVSVTKGGTMSEHYHEPAHEPARVQEPESNSLVGYAAIKYVAIVVIVLAILGFLAFYVLPKIG